MTPMLRFPGFSGEWKVKKLGSFSKTFSGGTPSVSNKMFYSGTIPFIKSGEISRGTTEQYITDDALKQSSAKLVQAGDILYALYGATSGQVAVSQISGAINQAVLCIRPDANTYFIYSKLMADKQKILDTYLQGGQGNLSAEIVKDLRIGLPKENEQEKIGGFLTVVDERIAAMDKKVELLQQYKKGIMQKIFTQKLRFKDENGNDYPDWETKRLGDIGRVVTGKTPNTSDKSAWTGNVLFVTPSDMSEDMKYQEKTQRHVNSVIPLPPGSIMYTCIASIGKMSISTRQSVTNQQINSLIPSEKYNNEFVYYGLLWLTPKIMSTQSNNTLPIINKTEFSKFSLQTPSKEEQQKIADFLTSLDDKINLEKSKLEQAKLFKKSLLQRMFV